MKRRLIPLFQSSVSDRSIERVVDVLHSGWLNEGPVVQEFQARLCDQLGLRNPVAVNSGTAALHLGLLCLGVGHGSEIILPAQTFVATGLAVLMAGGRPVFADIDPETGNLEPADVERKITPRTRAIIPVHWGGYPCDMDELQSLAAAHGLGVLEDAAHALGARYRGRTVGAESRFTAFSFQAIKHLTTGDGGVLACRDAADARRATTLRWFGIDRGLMKPGSAGERGYDIRELGFKYHMNDVAAAIGLGNLEALPDRLARRRAIASRYKQALSGLPGTRLLDWRDDRQHAYWLFTLRVERRQDFARWMTERGVQVSVVDLRIDKNPVFGASPADLPGQEVFDESQISIPVHEGLTDEEVGWIIESVQAGW